MSAVPSSACNSVSGSVLPSRTGEQGLRPPIHPSPVCWERGWDGGCGAHEHVPSFSSSFLCPSSPASAAALWGRAASPQRAKLSPELQSRGLSPSQRTLTLPEKKGARDGLDILIGRTAEELCPCAGGCPAPA